MSNGIIRVVARIVAVPEKTDELRALLLGLVEPSRAEDGCVRYELLQNEENPVDFVMLEEWQDGEALNTHLASAHILDAFGKVGALATGQPEIHQYRLLSERRA
jgi:quinol monooxygenase YgiN